MCAQFTLTCSPSELARFFELLQVAAIGEDQDRRVLPRQKSLIARRLGADTVIEEMQFSLVPSWSKEAAVKFATHNARLETITEKPTWRSPLEKYRGLVPMSAFVEPVYCGEMAGNMVRFSPTDQPLLAACAIFDCWRSPDGQLQIWSFAIVTGDPCAFVREIGHDRQPVFLERDVWHEWLDPIRRPGAEWVDLMRRNFVEPKLQASVARPLKPGWEKRIDA